MKIVQSNSISVNGMIAREDGDEDWLPSEGWDEFVEEASRCQNFIIGRETYEIVMKLYPNYNFDNVEAKFKLIVTRQPEFKQPAGYIVMHSPDQAVEFLEGKGIQAGLLVGGGKLNSSFYAKKLVDELWLTVNPTIIGVGRPFVGASDIEVSLKLIDINQLDKDRVKLRYSVIK